MNLEMKICRIIMAENNCTNPPFDESQFAKLKLTQFQLILQSMSKPNLVILSRANVKMIHPFHNLSFHWEL